MVTSRRQQAKKSPSSKGPKKTKVKAATSKRATPESKMAAQKAAKAKPPAAVRKGKKKATPKKKADAKPPTKPKAKLPAKPKTKPPAKPKPKRPPKPRKPAVDAEMQKKLREALVSQRGRLLSLVESTQAQMAEKARDLADVSDRASEGFEGELAVGLLAVEAAQLEDIEAAIRRIDDGTYGLCADCGKPIPRRRLEVLPFAKHCLVCKGISERDARRVGSYGEGEGLD